jgi:hypothetical protein
VASGLVAGIADRACSPRMAVRPLRGFPGLTVLIAVAPVLGCGVKFTLILGHIGLLVAAARLVGSATCSTWIIAHAACLPRGPRFIRLGHATLTEANAVAMPLQVSGMNGGEPTFPAFTLRVYAHMLPCSHDRARAVISERFSRVLGPSG